jgi:APA family basic amino acid/polyamine antiporter
VTASERSFRPSLNLFDAVSVGLGAIIGGGIFVVTGIVAGLAGPALVLSTAIAAVLALLTALSFVELAAWRPAEGSIHAYARLLLSPGAGFLAGWTWAISNIFSGAAVALGFSHYLTPFIRLPDVRLVAVLLCVALTALNYLGAKHSALVNNILVLFKLTTLAVFILAGLSHFEPRHFVPFFRPGLDVLHGAFFIFFAFSGFARVVVVAEEVRKPRTTVPRAIMLALGISTAVYILVGLVAIGLTGSTTLARSDSPLAAAMKATGHPLLVAIITAGGLVATASVLLTSILGVSRMTFAMARDGELPRRLSRLHPKFNTPSLSILLIGAATAAVTMLLPMSGAVAVSTFASLFCYALANASALRLPKAAALYPRAVAWVGLATCLAFLFLIPLKTTAAGMICLLSGVIVLGVERLAGRGIRKPSARL